MFAGRFELMIEELWKKLVERRATGAWINELARRARHLGLFLMCVTQQRSDLAGPWGKALWSARQRSPD
jgi:DNA helicase HerA-like ATPase